jgi:hypothetical protein
MPTQEQIARVLVPHQTIQERNLALCINNYMIFRTCYDPIIASKYAEIIEIWRDFHCYKDDDVAQHTLDNEAHYGDLDDDLRKLFLRMHQLLATVHYCGVPETQDLPWEDEPPDDASLLPLYNACMKESSFFSCSIKKLCRKRCLK